MKKLTVVLTVDDAMGLAFNNRRQSRDRNLIEDLMSEINGPVYVTGYSMPLFEKFADRVYVAEDPIKSCPDGASCFLEMTDISCFTEIIDKLIIYKWNRLYPSDVRLSGSPLEHGFRLISATDFQGSSHEIITKEIYIK